MTFLRPPIRNIDKAVPVGLDARVALKEFGDVKARALAKEQAAAKSRARQQARHMEVVRQMTNTTGSLGMSRQDLADELTRQARGEKTLAGNPATFKEVSSKPGTRAGGRGALIGQSEAPGKKASVAGGISTGYVDMGDMSKAIEGMKVGVGSAMRGTIVGPEKGRPGSSGSAKNRPPTPKDKEGRQISLSSLPKGGGDGGALQDTSLAATKSTAAVLAEQAGQDPDPILKKAHLPAVDTALNRKKYSQSMEREKVGRLCRSTMARLIFSRFLKNPG